MPEPVYLLAIDTSANLSSTCVYDSHTQVEVSSDVQDIGRGHAELLLLQIQRCLQEAHCGYDRLDRIVVSRGPGSFTGVRVGMATVRGLALALNIPAVGVSTLEACADTARRRGFSGSLLSTLEAKRGQVYCHESNSGRSWISTPETAADNLYTNPSGICGSGALEVARHLPRMPEVVHTLHVFPIDSYARLGARAHPTGSSLEPLYLRSADAKPQTDALIQSKSN